MIAGIVQDQAYFDELVATAARRRARVVHRRREPETSDRELLGGAHALLHLIDFDEPFGYSVVEAMACGTPVIAVAAWLDAGADRRGHVTGFLVADVDGAVAAVERVAALDRTAIRATAIDALRRRADGRRIHRRVRRDRAVRRWRVPVDGRRSVRH